MSGQRTVQCFVGIITMSCLMANPTYAGQTEVDLGAGSATPLQAGVRAESAERANPWVAVPPCPEGVSRPAGAVVSGKLYVIGGESLGGAGLGYIQEYDPITQIFGQHQLDDADAGIERLCRGVRNDMYIPGGYDGSYLLGSSRSTTRATNLPSGDDGDRPVPVGASGDACASYGGKIYVLGDADIGGLHRCSLRLRPGRGGRRAVVGDNFFPSPERTARRSRR